ncbi:serine protease inhibitor Kazal-type 2 isoform X3 [Bubalus bubalis]|uniref:serine protease inhibitor Kazal-type 2 isoform X3 n=1 Tax=Bubalus bubalis TaxID=89462 RepID=UPI001E1B95B4|nr:serine protease inhibitor Kazal-type 2 isoform X3 [Bubalus bubalis]
MYLGPCLQNLSSRRTGIRNCERRICQAPWASSNAQFGQPSEYSTPNCHQYTLPGCPRDFNPVCGSDLSTYPNECTLCMKIREDGRDIKVIRSGPC